MPCRGDRPRQGILFAFFSRKRRTVFSAVPVIRFLKPTSQDLCPYDTTYPVEMLMKIIPALQFDRAPGQRHGGAAHLDKGLAVLQDDLGGDAGGAAHLLTLYHGIHLLQPNEAVQV